MINSEIPHCQTCGAVQATLETPAAAKIAQKLSHCKCYLATYCSVDCQKADWKSHKVECLSIKPAPEIYKEIEKTSEYWKGNAVINIQKSPQEELSGPHARTIWWGKYARYMCSKSQPYLIEYVGDGQGKTALSLACGLSDATSLLIEKKYSVHAVDYSIGALEMAFMHLGRENPALLLNSKINFVCAEVPHFKWPEKVDLVYAGHALSYFDPKKIRATMTCIEKCLKDRGLFIGNFISKDKCKGPALVMMEIEMGNWMINNEASARALLEAHHFEIVKLGYVKDNPNSISFVARKKMSP